MPAMEQNLDAVIQNLPACKRFLANLKEQYDKMLQETKKAEKHTNTVLYRADIQCSKFTTHGYYAKRLGEVNARIIVIEADVARIRVKLFQMRKERDDLCRKKESKISFKIEKELQLISLKRLSLKLSAVSATNSVLLENYLKTVKDHLNEAEQISKTKYKFTDHKQKLHLQRRKTELENQALVTHNSKLTTMLKELRSTIEASKSFFIFLANEEIDRRMNIVTYILSTTVSQQKHPEFVWTEDETEDPLYEQEVEIILSSYEKFNTLFESQFYKEAALLATSSPKGALRTLETLERFKKFSKPTLGQKLPLLVYCEALMQSSPAYKPVSIQEAIECTKCALSQGQQHMISQWISQEWLPSYFEVAAEIFYFCSCQNRCMCTCKSMAFVVFEKCGAIKEASLCLLHQERYMSFLQYTHAHNFSLQDYKIIFCNSPSVELGKYLIMPPDPYHGVIEPIDAMFLLLNMKFAHIAATLLKNYLKHYKTSLAKIVMQDNRTSRQQWEFLIAALVEFGEQNTALDILAALVVSTALISAFYNYEKDKVIHEVESKESSTQLQTFSHIGLHIASIYSSNCGDSEDNLHTISKSD